MEPPETRYVAVGESAVAYKVIGEGPQDLLWRYGLGGHIDLFWAEESRARRFSQLASFTRLMVFDRRGTGSSDPVALNAMPTWEELTEDMTAVLDAARIDQDSVSVD